MDDTILARAHLVISGRVQGVWYRGSTRTEALRRSLFGWVKNLGDGSVEVVVEGDKKSVVDLIAWCKRGSPGSRVDDIKINWEGYTGEFDGFYIRY